MPHWKKQNNLHKTKELGPYSVTHDDGVIINGKKWATRNVDKPGTFTVYPEDIGMYYQWNRPLGWSSTDPVYTIDALGYRNDSPIWDGSPSTDTTWETTNNVCLTGWRIPTSEELQSLLNAENKWTTVNGKNGRVFGNSDSSIFLPVTYRRINNSPYGYGYSYSQLDIRFSPHGYYWSRNSTPKNSWRAYFLLFCFNTIEIKEGLRVDGHSVRCISDE